VKEEKRMGFRDLNGSRRNPVQRANTSQIIFADIFTSLEEEIKDMGTYVVTIGVQR
jgi:hypothetical protein